MKISFDSNAPRAELLLVADLVQQFLSATTEAIAAAIVAPAVIAPQDNPSAGVDTAAMFAPPAAAVVVPLPLALPTAPAALPPVVGIERDAEGLPWDARIHASTKTKTAKGVWTSRRGMNDAALVQKVKAEIGATLPAAVPQATVPAPVFAPQPTLALVPPAAPPVVAAIPPALPPVALPPAPPAAPQTFGELMTAAGPLLASGAIPPTALQDAATAIGVAQISMLATVSRPDLIMAIWQKLQPA